MGASKWKDKLLRNLNLKCCFSYINNVIQSLLLMSVNQNLGSAMQTQGAMLGIEVGNKFLPRTVLLTKHFENRLGWIYLKHHPSFLYHDLSVLNLASALTSQGQDTLKEVQNLSWSSTGLIDILLSWTQAVNAADLVPANLVLSTI